MAYQTVFKRYEIKYLITREQKERILSAMEGHMEIDEYGRSTIRNIYFDTDDYILARHSIAKPDFKEKLRIRSYSRADEDDMVFVELKRKYDHVVYKRRVALPEAAAMAWTKCKTSPENIPGPDGRRISMQMTSEINYFLSYYHDLKPAVFLSYDREAYRMKKSLSSADAHAGDFRVTFDENILCRDFDLSLGSAVYGVPILEPGKILMELKCSGGIPLWMTEVLSEERVYKTSFSKYGTFYQSIVMGPEDVTSHRRQRAAAGLDVSAAASHRKMAAAGQAMYAANPRFINARAGEMA